MLRTHTSKIRSDGSTDRNVPRLPCPAVRVPVRRHGWASQPWHIGHLFAPLVGILLLGMFAAPLVRAADPAPVLTFASDRDNDLYRAVVAGGAKPERCDTPA